MFGQNKKKLKILKLSRDVRYLQKVALKRIQKCLLFNLKMTVEQSKRRGFLTLTFIVKSFKIVENKIYKTNLLIWTGLHHSVPKYLKESNVQFISLCSFIIEDSVFDVTKKKSKHFYSLLLNKKGQLPNMASKLQNDFNFTSEQLQKCVIYLIK